ncbi:hypothetical protein [Rhizobium sp. Leaf341]|uniref:hypothetical protein n=1 Tax=Rhizobium sp. Leaf341 TaxID=1736344 RepID=UPI0007153F77|nr:hypothetical protein [Rhizobium sp. Leaf341]KQR71559.1 hypothetical protein ASG03_03475 [Rhizobium sp. Leaf341]
MKILRDDAWVGALTEVAEKGRRLHKEVCLHTHFNHPDEVTGITEDASAALFERGIAVRNQAVLLRNVNDDAGSLIELGRRLGALNIHPYYVYLADLVKGTEDLRTTIGKGIAVEKAVRGSTAGFNTPTFVVDTPGGGGKRDVHSFEYYDPKFGVAIYTAPSVRKGKLFISVDPLRDLEPAVQQIWRDAADRTELLSNIIQKVGHTN